MIRVLFAAAYSGVLMLGACASSPAHAPAPSANAAGYSDTKIENDRWRVSYRRDTRISSAQVQDYALMRAAQLTLEQGGD